MHYDLTYAEAILPMLRHQDCRSVRSRTAEHVLAVVEAGQVLSIHLRVVAALQSDVLGEAETRVGGVVVRHFNP